MGGMGFIEDNKAACMLNVLIDAHMLAAAQECGARRFFYASTACVYNADKQRGYDVTPLREDDAYPAMPEDGYGWEKLFAERLSRHFSEDFGLTTRVARLHNVYGPFGTWDGGREKAPAAICRKVAAAKVSGVHEIEIWGDGRQGRSFMFIDDCIEGILRIMDSDVDVPINLGSSETVTIDDLVGLVEEVAGIRLQAHVPARGAAGSRRPQQRQQHDPGAPRVATLDASARRHPEDLRLDLRSVRGAREATAAPALTRLCRFIGRWFEVKPRLGRADADPRRRSPPTPRRCARCRARSARGSRHRPCRR